MDQFKIAISSWGNIGKAVADVHQQIVKHSIDNNDPHDIELVGIIRRDISNINLADYPSNVEVVSNPNDLSVRPDVIICTAPSDDVTKDVARFLNMNYCTVDCYDDHKNIYNKRQMLEPIARRNESVSILSGGWDPGHDSDIRCLFHILSPLGITYTTFGPGRSMGHTTRLKSFDKLGIMDAVAITSPGSTPGMHIRDAYIVVKDGSNAAQIESHILNNDYFKNATTEKTNVHFVPNVAPYNTTQHGGIVENTGYKTQLMARISGNNPTMTAAHMYAHARMAIRAREACAFGAYTVVERPKLDCIKGATIKERLDRIKY